MPLDREPRWPLLLVLLGLALVLAPVFRNGLVYDDTQLIAQSRFIHDVRNLPTLFEQPSMVAFNIYAGHANAVDTFRPLTIASFMWDAALSGKATWSYHLTNLILHLVCVVLVFRLARSLLPKERASFAYFGAAWFGLGPLQSEAHVWISGRYELLSAVFALAAILRWRRGRSANSDAPTLAQGASVSALFLLALLSKEVPLLTLPALWLWPESEPRSRALLRELWRRGLALWPFAAATGVYLLLRMHALHGLRTHRDQSQALLALSHLPVLLLDGLAQALVPSKIYLRILSEEYARLGAAQIALAAFGVLAVAGLALALLRRLTLLSWGLLWFGSLLAPVCIVTTLHWPGFGRYLYLASAGLFVGVSALAGELWARFPKLHRIAGVGVAAYAALLLLLLERQIASYRSSEVLFQTVIQERPDLAHGYGMLAAHYSGQLRRLPLVAWLYQQAVERNPEKFEYAKGLADTLFLLDRRADMLAVAEAAEKRMGPNAEWQLIEARGVILEQPALALAHLLRCLQLSPGEPRCASSLRELVNDPNSGPSYRELLAQALANVGPDPRLAEVAALVRSDPRK